VLSLYINFFKLHYNTHIVSYINNYEKRTLQKEFMRKFFEIRNKREIYFNDQNVCIYLNNSVIYVLYMLNSYIMKQIFLILLFLRFDSFRTFFLLLFIDIT